MKLLWLFTLSFLSLGCMAKMDGSTGFRSANNLDGYPKIEIREENGGSNVYWGDILLVELKENRYLRFRATPQDEKWIGTERKGADLCWAYLDEKAKGMEVLGTAHEIHPERGEFALVVKARKPFSAESKIDIRFVGKWIPETKKFRYTYTTSLECPLETWYQNSRVCEVAQIWNKKATSRIEVTDYHIDFVSMPDRLGTKQLDKPLLYEWFVKSSDGANWRKSPKIHIPYPIRPGKYVTISEGDPYTSDGKIRTPVGGYFGFLDTKQGGWMTQLKKSPVPADYGLCWTYFDVHHNLFDAVPPRGTTETLFIEYELDFEPVEPERAREIIAQATEVGWRSLEEYKLPLCTWDNRFDKLITDLPSEDTGNHYIWWASTYECRRDDTTGYDDNYSVTIKREKDAARPVAWNTITWCRPFTPPDIRKHKIRFSAMVKTKDCAGLVRLGVSTGAENYYSQRNFNKDGSYNTEAFKLQFSSSITGTNDWIPISMEFTTNENINSLILEQHGIGQSWFDNVKIEDLGEAKP